MVEIKIFEGNTSCEINEQMNAYIRRLNEKIYDVKPYGQLQFLNNKYVMTLIVDYKKKD